MCGIAGIVDLSGESLIEGRDAPLLAAMGKAIEHRGPDDSQSTIWKNVGFSFRRLSIVDISGGMQPFDSADKRLCSMVNGEVYNHQEIRRSLAPHHRLQSNSDCEVIQHLYLDRELDLFKHVNGMFAAAVLDKQKRRLILGRDRVGIKPLYYSISANRRWLLFASEVKSLIIHPETPRQFDWQAALSLGRVRNMAGSELPSFFSGVHSLPAGHLMDIDLATGKHKIHRYWQLPGRPVSAMGRSAQWYVDGYRERLAASVERRLMRDVDLGIFLSGGVDSAAIVALVAQNQNVPSFTVCSRSTGEDVAAAIKISAHVRTINHQVLFQHTRSDAVPDHWRKVLWACELPSITVEQLYKYNLHAFARERYPNLKIMLLGQGADEFAGGYMEASLGRQILKWRPEHWDLLGRRFDELDEFDEIRAASLIGLLPEQVNRLQAKALSSSNLRKAAGRQSRRCVWDRYNGYFRGNLDYHLWHEDRTASAHSIEDRVPFLDHELLEFIAQIPEEHHPELFSDKQILRRAVADLLPADIVQRPKGYFFYGKQQHYSFRMMHQLLVANNAELLEQALAGSEASDGALDKDGLLSYANSVGEDPGYTGLTDLLSLVNMGLLADMVRGQQPHGQGLDQLPVFEISKEEAGALAALDESLLRLNASAELEKLIVSWAKGVSLRVDHVGTASAIHETSGATHRITSPAWGDFLSAIDGKQSVGDIITNKILSKQRSLKQLRVAIDAELLVLSYKPADGGIRYLAVENQRAQIHY